MTSPGTAGGLQNAPVHGAPLRFEVAPLRTFLEVPFDGDPTYVSIEVQVLDVRQDPHNPVEGMAVLLTRRGGQIDVYMDARLGLDEEWFQTDGSTANVRQGIIRPLDFNIMGTTEVLSRASIDVDQRHVEAEASFVDADGRRIELVVDADRRATKPNGVNVIPAPRGPTQVRQLPFLFAPEFWLLTRANSSIRVSIDGVPRSPTLFPVPVGWKRRYYARFATELSLVSLNPTSGEEKAWTLDEGLSNQVGVDTSTVYELDHGQAGAGACIHSVTSRGTAADLSMVFDPPLPVRHLQTAPRLSTGTVSGVVRFFFGQAVVGRGNYRSSVVNGTVQFRLSEVVQDWRPPWSQASLLVLSLVRRITRRGRSYTWSCSSDGIRTTASWAEHRAGSETG